MRAATYGGFGPCVDYDPGASAGASNGPVLYGMMQAIVTEAVPLTGPVKCRCGGEPRVARVAEAGGGLSARPGSIPGSARVSHRGCVPRINFDVSHECVTTVISLSRGV